MQCIFFVYLSLGNVRLNKKHVYYRHSQNFHILMNTTKMTVFFFPKIILSELIFLKKHLEKIAIHRASFWKKSDLNQNKYCKIWQRNSEMFYFSPRCINHTVNLNIQGLMKFWNIYARGSLHLGSPSFGYFSAMSTHSEQELGMWGWVKSCLV